MKKKTKAFPAPVKSDVNQNILNIITPSGVDYDACYANVGNNIGQIYCISKYPMSCDYGWLSNLCNLEGTATTVEYRYTPSDRMTKVMNKRISELKSNLETIKDESEKQQTIQGIQDLTEMINRITVRGEPVGYVNIILFIQAMNRDEYKARLKRVSSAVAISECNIRNLKFRQFQALQAISPYGLPNVHSVSNMGERNMPISTFMGGFPMAAAGLNDNDGYYIARTKNNRIVRLNQWIRNKDRTNSNWIVTGVPGVGKSTALKLLFTKEYAYGTKIIIFDPEKEYVDLARSTEVQGDVIDCAAGTTGRINPLQIRVAPKIKTEDLDEGEALSDYFTYEETNGGSDMALYIQQLRLFFAIYFGKENFNFEVKTLLEECLIDLYNQFGIYWDTEISKLKNTDFPIMEDLYKLVLKKAKSGAEEYKRALYSKIAMLLQSAAAGADKFIWNGHTTLDPKSDFIDLDVSNLLEADDNVKRAQFYNITMWGWQQMAANRNEKVLFGIDEGYLFVDPDYPDLMKFLRNISKRARKYEGGLMFITHSCVDVLDESVKRYGQAIIDNACYKFIMGCDGKNLKDTQSLFNLSDREVAILASKNRGQGVFMCGGVRLNMTIDVKDEFLEMFGSAGGR
ncbi:MAG: ATP-binding protein [Clostridium sp.]|nr:ATP-binding protein [Clostridium sp.]